MCELFTASSLFFRFSLQQVNCSEVFHLTVDPTLKRFILSLFYLYITMTCPLSTYEHKHTPYIRGKHKHSVQLESSHCLLVTAVCRFINRRLSDQDHDHTGANSFGNASRPKQSWCIHRHGWLTDPEWEGSQNECGCGHVRLATGRGAKLWFTLWPSNISVRPLNKHHHQNKHTTYTHSEMIS